MTAYYKGGIVSAGKFYARFIVFDVFSDGFRLSEIHCGVFDRGKFSCRKAVFVTNGESFRIYFKNVVMYVSASRSVKIKIAVVGKVKNGVLIGFGAVFNGEAVFFPTHFNAYFKVSGIAFFTIGRSSFENDKIAFLLRIPDKSVETFLSAVKVVRAVVDEKLIFFAVQFKLAFADAVSDSSDGCAEIAISGNVFFNRVVTENDVNGIFVFIRNDKGLDGCAVIKNFCGKTVFVYKIPAKNFPKGSLKISIRKSTFSFSNLRDHICFLTNSQALLHISSTEYFASQPRTSFAF